jgi:ribonucleoside-diphosphate reductase alpha chain
MDCDTTGIEPDFALVKFKKLAGGGYFKIINQSVPAALRKLGYGEAQIAEIIAYAVGHGSLGQAPHINHTALIGHGFGAGEIARVEAALPTAFDIRFVFNQYTLGEAFCRETLGIPAEKLNDPGFDLLRHLGFSRAKSRRPMTMSGHHDAGGRAAPQARALCGLRLRQSLRQDRQALLVWKAIST